MPRKYLYSVAALAILAIFTVTWALAQSTANQSGKQPVKATAPLPIAQVILFNSGVGYFERQGEVNGDTKVELSFPTSDVNDLLKSLVLQDMGGGRVQAINYDSQDPVEKILRSFTLDLNCNPTYGQILNQARGEAIEVMRQEKPGANPFKMTGIIIGIEMRAEAPEILTRYVERLNLLTNEGMLSIPLPQVLSVRFLNQTLENEFRRALQILAGSHDVQKKTVALQFNGNGKRGVKVGYVVERPIWKTTYRMVLEPNGKLFMQGWAIVENTSDDDWNNVRMVLVSGKPISFQMDLYAPLWVPRPFVEPELFASLRPPLYGVALERDQLGAGLGGFPAVGGQFGGLGGGLGGLGGFGGLGGGLGGFPGGGFGGGGGKGGSNASGLRGSPVGDLVIPQQNANQRLLFEEMMKRKEAQGKAREAGETIAGLNYKEGIQSIASSSEVGDYYQYIIDQKISVARQKSAMLPILNQTIEGSKVSIYNEAVHDKYPLLGLRFKNTSGKPLTQGPITVFDDGSYGGDTRILDIQPNEQRLLSYALDQSTEVKTTVKTHPAPDMTLNIGGNNLTATYTLRQTKTYTVKNRGTKDRTLIIEHPIRGEWKLVDAKSPKERTRDVYRFQIEVKAGQVVNHEVIEDQTRVDAFALSKDQDSKLFYAIADGIQIRPEIQNDGPKLLALAINKGVLEASYKERESKTYFIQNQSERDHRFTVDHVIRKEWKRLAADGNNQDGPAVYRFNLAVNSRSTAHQEVLEERVWQERKRTVAELSETELRKYIAHPAPSAKVKAVLQQVLDKQAGINAAVQQLADNHSAQKILIADQARVRENLRFVPQSSEHYKDFLTKFVAQEKQIEEGQRQIRTQEAAVYG
jgi:hypothetical protein